MYADHRIFKLIKQDSTRKTENKKMKERCRDGSRTLTLLLLSKTFQAKQQNKMKEVTGILVNVSINPVKDFKDKIVRSTRRKKNKIRAKTFQDFKM